MNAATEAERSTSITASVTSPRVLRAEGRLYVESQRKAPKPKPASAPKQPRQPLRERINWGDVGGYCFAGFLCCGALVVFCVGVGFIAALIDMAIWGDNTFVLLSWHGVASVLLTLLVLPFALMIGLALIDGTHITPALSNSNSPLGHELRELGFAPPTPPAPTPQLEKGRSQFATLPSVQQSGIWKP